MRSTDSKGIVQRLSDESDVVLPANKQNQCWSVPRKKKTPPQQKQKSTTPSFVQKPGFPLSANLTNTTAHHPKNKVRKTTQGHKRTRFHHRPTTFHSLLFKPLTGNSTNTATIDVCQARKNHRHLTIHTRSLASAKANNRSKKAQQNYPPSVVQTPTLRNASVKASAGVYMCLFNHSCGTASRFLIFCSLVWSQYASHLSYSKASSPCCFHFGYGR